MPELARRPVAAVLVAVVAVMLSGADALAHKYSVGKLTCAARAAIDPQTKEAFLGIDGQIYACRKCRVPVAPASKYHYFGVETGHAGSVSGNYVLGATAIIRAYEKEVGGDPSKITMPEAEFLRRWRQLVKSVPGDWKEPFGKPKCTRIER